MTMPGRSPDRNPNGYSIGVPQIMFSPIPNSGNFEMWRDWRALASAMFGITDSSGKVVNSHGKVVGTPAEIMADHYLGALDGVNVGGDVEQLEHTVANRGYEEVDRVVVLSRPVEYNFSFDEPDIKNLNRFFVGQESNLGLSLKMIEVSGTTFAGSDTEAITVVNYSIGNPDKALDTIVATWQSNGGPNMPPNGVYGFIVGATNEDPCVGAWEHKRQWLAYATFDFTNKTTGPWAYIRPKGTAADGLYGGDTLLDVNNSVHSIPDSDPVISKCDSNAQWNVNAKLAWNGFMWVRSDEGFYGFGIIGTKMSFKRTAGCALIVNLTEIGTSTIHVIPKCTLMPDGSMAFNMDAWMQGSFKMQVQRDNSAVLIDRTPALPVPFGYVQTMELPEGM